MKPDCRQLIAVLMSAGALLAGGMLPGSMPWVFAATDARGDRQTPVVDSHRKEYAGPESTPSSMFANSSWRLVAFQSTSDEIGKLGPDDTHLYTMFLGGDGTVKTRLNCNRANGTWSADPGGRLSGVHSHEGRRSQHHQGG